MAIRVKYPILARNVYVLLNANESNYGKKQKDENISKLLGITMRTLGNIRKKLVLEGFARWSLRLFSNKMVELKYADLISHETVRTVLRKRIKTVEIKRLANLTAK